VVLAAFRLYRSQLPEYNHLGLFVVRVLLFPSVSALAFGFLTGADRPSRSGLLAGLSVYLCAVVAKLFVDDRNAGCLPYVVNRDLQHVLLRMVFVLIVGVPAFAAVVVFAAVVGVAPSGEFLARGALCAVVSVVLAVFVSSCGYLWRDGFQATNLLSFALVGTLLAPASGAARGLKQVLVPFDAGQPLGESALACVGVVTVVLVATFVFRSYGIRKSYRSGTLWNTGSQ
jgi:hypothetical protein